MLKLMLFLLIANINLYSCSCTEPILTNSMIDANVTIDAQKSKTSFHIYWKFKKDFIKSLAHYDKNQNSKFDKDEQKSIKDDFVSYVKSSGYLTDIIYIKKDQKIKKSRLREFKIIDSKMIFSNEDIEYYFNFDMNFTLEKDHRLYIRFFDSKSNINIALNNIVLNNYKDIKVIEPQNSRANIYFYKHTPKDNLDSCAIKEHNHHKEHEHHD